MYFQMIIIDDPYPKLARFVYLGEHLAPWSFQMGPGVWLENSSGGFEEPGGV
jgi:hypothetical protein